MLNYSDAGIYFESDALLESGAEVYIGLRHAPFEDRPSDYTCHRATIMWRKDLKEDAHFFYGYGTEVSLSESPRKAKSHRKQRRHPRRPFNRPVRFAADHTISEGLAVDISLGWLWMFNPTFSVLNWVLTHAGLIQTNVSWLSNPYWAMFSMVTVNVWRGLPFFAITMRAGLVSIPQELYKDNPQ